MLVREKVCMLLPQRSLGSTLKIHAFIANSATFIHSLIFRSLGQP